VRQLVSTPIHRTACFWVGIFAGVLLACSGRSWVSATPAVFGSAGVEPDVIVARCVNRAQELGYSVRSVDYEGGSLQLVALRRDTVMLGLRLVPKSSSWLMVMVGDDRTVTVQAYGDLVSEGRVRMHPGLRAEMDWLAKELESAIRGDSPSSEAEPTSES
jgi:hypothetical protein